MDDAVPVRLVTDARDSCMASAEALRQAAEFWPGVEAWLREKAGDFERLTVKLTEFLEHAEWHG